MFGLTSNEKAAAEAPDLKQQVQDAIDAYFAELAEKCKAIENLSDPGEEGTLNLAKCMEDFAGEKAKFEMLLAAANNISSLVNAKFKEMSESLTENMHELEQAMKDACVDADGNPDAELFSDKKSIDFAYGTVGFRDSKELEIDTDGEQENTLVLLRKLPRAKRELYVEMVPKLNKALLKKQDEEFLASVNARLKEKQNFYVTPRTVVL